jgi:hypothetical protein
LVRPLSFWVNPSKFHFYDVKALYWIKSAGNCTWPNIGQRNV